jgi:hypothetical protein
MPLCLHSCTVQCLHDKTVNLLFLCICVLYTLKEFRALNFKWSRISFIGKMQHCDKVDMMYFKFLEKNTEKRNSILKIPSICRQVCLESR